MDRDQHLDKLVRQMEELGFLDLEMHAYLDKRWEANKMIYSVQEFVGKDELIFEARFLKNQESGVHELRGFKAMLLQKGIGITEAFFPFRDSLTDITVQDAYHLLQGRAVMKFNAEDDSRALPHKCYWTALKNGKLREIPEYDFSSQLIAMGIQELSSARTGPPLLYDFMAGERVGVHLNGYMGLTRGYVQADPLNKGIRLFDENHREVKQELNRKRQKQVRRKR
jgi:hypothetical protein